MLIGRTGYIFVVVLRHIKNFTFKSVLIITTRIQVHAIIGRT
jgi:hypothetical protein